MIPQDLSDIEVQLDIRLPTEYWDIMLSGDRIREKGFFNDASEIISTNLRMRRMSWLGRPLDKVFFVFGKDAKNCELLLDMDVPGFLVMVADHEYKKSKVLAISFAEWLKE